MNPSPAASAKCEFSFTVNGEAKNVLAHPMERLLDVLRNNLGLTGAKEGCGELRGVEQQKRDALFHLNTQVEETIADAVTEFGDLGVRVGRSLVKDGGFSPSSLEQIVIQEGGCSVELFWYAERRYSR